MNVNHDHQLKVAVERIVRPIVASERDKLKMREELYGHAAEAFEFGLSCGLNKDAAAAQAIERLGQAETVRRELQATVSRRSRIDFYVERFLRRPGGGSALLHAAKLGIAIGGGVTLFMLMLFAAPYFFGVKKCNGEVCALQTLSQVWPDLVFGVGSRLLPMFFTAVFNVSLLLVAWEQHPAPGRRGFAGRLARQSLLVLAALWAQSLVFVLPNWLDRGPWLSLFEVFLWCLLFTTAAAVAVLPWNWLNARRCPGQADWLALDLGEAASE